jgi:hypothetical protein
MRHREDNDKGTVNVIVRSFDRNEVEKTSISSYNQNSITRNTTGVEQGVIHLENESIWKKIGFLRPLWWLIHLIGIAVIYTIGLLLWR